MEVTDAVFYFDDKALEYRIIDPQVGRKDDEATIVMLHEGLGSISLWKEFPQLVAEVTQTRVVLYSRLGYGNSTPLTEARSVRYMHDEALITLPALLSHLEVTTSILVGHSDGASISIIYAGGGGYAVDGLVLLAPHIFVEDVTVRSIEAARNTYLTTDLPKKLSRYHCDSESTFWGWNDIWLSPDFRSWNIEAYVKKLTCRSLLIQSTEDPYGSIDQIKCIERLSPKPTKLVLLEDCGHSPHVDQRELTLKSLVDFVSSLR